MKKPFILGINGSPFKDGSVMKLINKMLDAAEKEGAEIRVIHLYDLHIINEPGLYSINHKKAIPENMPVDDIVKLYPEIQRADALVFGTPVYWSNMSAVMKSFIEHLTPLENDGYKLEGKLAALIAASKEDEGGKEMAVMSMAAPLGQMGFMIPPNAMIWYPGDWYTTSGKHKDWAIDTAAAVGVSMTKLIKLLGDNPIVWS